MTEESLAGAQLRAQTDNEPTHGGGYPTSLGYVQLDVVCWSAILGTAVGLTMWMLRQALHRDVDEPSPPTSTPGFCCETLVIEMSRRANLSVDACRNFLDYTCYHREGLAEADQKLFVKEVLYPTLQGTIRTPASDVLRSYYLSCLTAFVEGLSTTEGAVNTIIDMFFTLSGGADLRAVDLAGLVEIKFGTSFLFTVVLQLDTNNKTCTAYFTRGSNFKKLCDTMAVTIMDRVVIRTSIDVVDSPYYHSVSLVLFIFATTASLFDKGFLSDSITGEGSAKWTEFCDTDIGALHELWDLVSVHRFTNHERDSTLRSLYDSISGAVVADAIDIFASPEDVDNVRALISSDTVFEEEPTDLNYPLLSLRSAVRAVAGAGWHTPVRMWSLWTMSPSQFFYMRFYLHYVCQRYERLRLEGPHHELPAADPRLHGSVSVPSNAKSARLRARFEGRTCVTVAFATHARPLS
ncbi:hypothetical protein HPB51_011745 [Rhipicephalus microplus]|uniref:Uncharacterized protein n=1 Tax=Rhipicephalus microplus TaxID=6941 RepID=A0A9J6DMR2_RHIMP|nr:hypothetical protein HPB51_011745 [Rhipicephalus microplus]